MIRQRPRQPGYYPGYSTLSQRNFWDAATRQVVEKRVYDPPKIRFFTSQELPLAAAVFERILPQDDRLPEFRIPILNYIDDRLFENRISGYRYEDMPEDREAHRLGLAAIDATAQALYSASFIELDPLKQDLILKSIHDGKQLAAHELWSRMSINRYWQLLVGDCVAAYYAHPWAWDEIGYGGPAYPRAYTRLEGGMPEPWEVDERRYDWAAPANSISDVYEETGAGSDTSHQGQGGTH
ncbi:MAG: gluconate 2-dehydrogenase subunit 3 family protein [Bryobacteraceae bacterium]